jgi:hypothetical protein
MANDRIFIRCKGCGRWIGLCKYYPGHLDYLDDKGGFTLGDWLHSHSEEDKFLKGDLESDPGFELLTEQSLTDGRLDFKKEGM